MGSDIRTDGDLVHYSKIDFTTILLGQLDIPKDARSMKVTAYYEDMDGDQVTTELPAISFYSASETYVHVSTSNDHGSVGQSVVFHLKCNQHFDSYQYVVRTFRFLPDLFIWCN